MKRALAVFTGVAEAPQYTLSGPATRLQMHVELPTCTIRPYVLCAMLRDVRLDERSYNSFLDLQDRLHHNICRRRTLVAIGTHDADKLTPPFRYRALPPGEINFTPLAQTRSFSATEASLFFFSTPALYSHPLCICRPFPSMSPLRACPHRGRCVLSFPQIRLSFFDEQLFDYYGDSKNNSPLKKFLPIVSGSPVYPVLYDANETVMSLPPIINGEHSKMSPSTRNVLIECTATDLTKGHFVLNTIVAMFSEYCATPFSVEPLEVVYPTYTAADCKSFPSLQKLSGRTMLTPDLSNRELSADVGYIQRAIGLGAEALPAASLPPLLSKMMIPSKISADEKTVTLTVPITRPDLMHACDVVEDVAVAYSFNKIPRHLPKVVCTGSQQPIQKLTELMRLEMAQMGFTEALTFALCSTDDIFTKMRREDDGKSAVVISNPKTEEFQVCRTSLLPGLLKTLARNKSNPLPWKLFEVSDIVVLDETADVGASNHRRLAVAYSDSSTSGFEVVHGAVERALQMLGPRAKGFTVKRGSDPSFLEGRCAELFLADGTKVGVFGTVHPEVLAQFEIDYPTSAADIYVDIFL